MNRRKYLLQKYNFSRTLRKVYYTLPIYLGYIFVNRSSKLIVVAFYRLRDWDWFQPYIRWLSVICGKKGRKYIGHDPRKLFRQNFIFCALYYADILSNKTTLVKLFSIINPYTNASKSIYWRIGI